MDTFCLVALNSQYVHTNLAVRLIKNTDEYNNTIVLEHTINSQMDLVLEDIVSKNPKCVLFSCYIWNITYIYEMISSLKKVLPDSIVALAGPEVSYTYKNILSENTNVDIVCFGTGEITYPQLQKGILENDLSGVEGICYRQNSEILVNPIYSQYDIDTQAFPYYDINDINDRILYFETSRGCPFNCSYCISSIEKGVQLMNTEKIKENFEVFFQHNAKQVKLVDRTFNYPVKRAIEIIKIMLELKQKYPETQTSFHCELNPLLINEELVDILSAAPDGFLQFEIGVQSTNSQTLQAIRRDVDLKKQFKNITMLTQLQNIKVYVDLIAGLPYETYDIFINSFNDVYCMNAGGIHLGFLKVLKGSYMQSCVNEYDIEYQEYAPYKILKSKYISYSELCHLEKIESLVDTYYNSGNFKASLKYAVSMFEMPYDFYNSFCLFLLDKNYFSRPHKFIYYYDILFDFLSHQEDCNTSILQSVLLHDYALNSKPRVYPKCIQSAYSQKKKVIAREFYNNPENIEKYLPEYIGISPSTISRQCNIEIYDYDVLSKDIVKQETVLLYDYMNKPKIHRIK